MGSKIKNKPSISPNGSNGPNGRQNAINLRLRHDILEGIFPPGSRLPTKIELQKEYHTTSATVQNALHKMKADGFTRSEGKRGTFVADYPPCHSRYAIVFPRNINLEKNTSTFWQVLARLASQKKREDGVDFSLYMGLNGHVDEPDYKRLLQDLHLKNLAGIIFASPVHLIEKTPLFKEIIARKNLPKVAFVHKSSYPEIPSISTDPDDLLMQSLNLFQSRKCRRLAVLGALSGTEGAETLRRETELPTEAKRKGMELRPEWIQCLPHTLSSRARLLTQLLLQGERGKRPDALLILDSSLVESAMTGIEDLGLDPAKDITVVGHCNFPEPPNTKTPITFIGFNVEMFLDTCLKLMNKQRKGSLNPPMTLIPFEVRESVINRNENFAIKL